MTAARSSLGRLARLIGLGAVLALPLVPLLAADPDPQTDAFPTFDGYIKVSGEAPWISGDGAAFAKGTGAPGTGSGGIEDLHYSKDITNDTTVTVDGHALEGTDDYLARSNLSKDDLGSVDVGYKRFRTFYDGVGGFFPRADEFNAMSPENLHVDRSSFWATTKLARPNQPVFTLSFHDEIRTGMKDSSEWGSIVNPLATVAGGVLVGTAVPANTPFVAPNVLELDEHHDLLEAQMVASVGNTTETFKVTSDWVDNNDGRDYVKFPGSTVTADPTVLVHDDQESRKAATFRVLNQTETKLSDRVALDTGLTCSRVASENAGNWITPAYTATANAVYPVLTAGDIYGGSQAYDYVGNVFLKLTPNANWRADLGFREEADVTSSSGGFLTTSVATGATTVASASITTAHDLTYSHYTDHIASPEISAQYLGFDHLALYGTFDDRIDRGNQHWINPYAITTTTGTGVVTPGAAPLSSVFFQEANQDNDDAKVGANWNVSSQLTIRAEVFRKDHVNRFIGADGIVGTASYTGLYVTGYTFTGVTTSVIYKPVPALSFNTRYQPQMGDMAVTANPINGGLGTESTSGKARSQLISETIDWTPNGKIYLQGSVNVAYNYIQTAYPYVVVSTTTYTPTPIQNANNNYVVGSALCGFVLDQRTDALLQGSWQRANNYNPAIAAGGQPYGASYEEESVTAGLKHKFGDRLMGDCKVGYLEKTDPTTGGFTNYHGPLAYAALTYSL
jgi:hypothetical protein